MCGCMLICLCVGVFVGGWVYMRVWVDIRAWVCLWVVRMHVPMGGICVYVFTVIILTLFV